MKNERFFGVHFDFHAREDCTKIGETVTDDMLDDFLDRVKPDFIQCDCKGHPGFSSYPTKVGNPAPGFVKNVLPIFRKATRDRNIGLYMHYSGVWDSESIKHHPDWARIDEKGEADPNNTSVFGEYVDKLMIPQLQELYHEYGVDGAWIDGECWATCQEYNKKYLRNFMEQYGLTELPVTKEDPYFYEFSQYCREGFRNYLRHYLDVLHETCPGIKITSNWAFTSRMPEQVSANVDYISGDYSLQDSVRSARFDGRSIDGQGKPWDLMAWAFSGKFSNAPKTNKPAVQLKQEAAQVLALGGGFQLYYTQNRDASIPMWQTETTAEVAAFCRERKEFCFQSKPINQISILFSTYDFYRQNDRMFSGWSGILTPIQGILNAALDANLTVDLQFEYQLHNKMQEFPLIIIPESHELEEEFKEELRQYVYGGGSVLVIGDQASRMFATELGLGKTEQYEPQYLWAEGGGWLNGTDGNALVCQPDAEIFEYYYEKNDKRSPKHPLSCIKPYGKGKFGAILCNCGVPYSSGQTFGLRELIKSMAERLFPQPVLQVKTPCDADFILREKDGKLYLHCINMLGQHNNPDIYTFNAIPSIHNIEVCLNLGRCPQKLVLQPEGTVIPFVYQDGKIRFTIDKLDIYGIISVE